MARERRDVYRVATSSVSDAMRGPDERQAILFSYRSIDDRIPRDHPLRAMRRLVDPLLVELSPRFQEMYAATGRPSIPPEQLLRALLLQVTLLYVALSVFPIIKVESVAAFAV